MKLGFKLNKSCFSSYDKSIFSFLVVLSVHAKLSVMEFNKTFS